MRELNGIALIVFPDSANVERNVTVMGRLLSIVKILNPRPGGNR